MHSLLSELPKPCSMEYWLHKFYILKKFSKVRKCRRYRHMAEFVVQADGSQYQQGRGGRAGLAWAT